MNTQKLTLLATLMAKPGLVPDFFKGLKDLTFRTIGVVLNVDGRKSSAFRFSPTDILIALGDMLDSPCWIGEDFTGEEPHLVEDACSSEDGRFTP